MLPSIAKNNAAFKEQDYWRGRIWGHMNFLVYMGLLNYDLPEAREILSDKSEKLFMDDVNIYSCIFENYNGITDNVTNPEEERRFGDNYFHWSALPSFIAMLQHGVVESPVSL